MADLTLPRGEIKVLQAEDKDYKRGLLVRLLKNGGYDMAYWFNKPDKAYPVEVLVDGKSIKKDAKVVEMKFHPKDYYDKQKNEITEFAKHLDEPREIGKKKKINSKDLDECYKKILIIFSPILPHLISECLEEMGYNKNNLWPEVNEKYLENSKIDYVIQINGKKRSIISVESGMREKEILEKIKNDKLVDKYISGKNIFKSIYVQDKIINLIIK